LVDYLIYNVDEILTYKIRSELGSMYVSKDV